MIRRALPLAGLLALAPSLALAEVWPLGDVAAPSGLPLTLEDVIFEENPWSGELLVVVRLIAPTLADDIATPSTLRADMDWACETWGVPAAETLAAPPDFVVVEMMEEPVERGTTAPEIRQVFEQYSLEGPICIWELF